MFDNMTCSTIMAQDLTEECANSNYIGNYSDYQVCETQSLFMANAWLAGIWTTVLIVLNGLLMVKIVYTNLKANRGAFQENDLILVVCTGHIVFLVSTCTVLICAANSDTILNTVGLKHGCKLNQQAWRYT